MENRNVFHIKFIGTTEKLFEEIEKIKEKDKGCKLVVDFTFFKLEDEPLKNKTIISKIFNPF